MRSVKVIIEFVVLLSLIVLGIYFGSENAELVSMKIAGSVLTPTPLWVIVLAAFVGGAVLSGCFFSWEVIRLWLENRRLKKQTSSPHSDGESGSAPEVPTENSFSSSSGASSTGYAANSSFGERSFSSESPTVSPPSRFTW